MCGIAGYFLKDLVKHDSSQIELLLNSVRQRGPDDEGICLINRERKSSQFYKTDLTVPSVGAGLPHIAGGQSIGTYDLALIHTRYAIIDLTSAAHQPFVSSDNSIVAVFNGEIYNYIELRNELSARGVNFCSTSDTEVLIEGYRAWGDKLWAKMNGFWAVALYDFKNDRIVFSRDRIGVAPLYYREMSNGFFFASAIQSLIDIEPKGIDLDNDVLLGFGLDHRGISFKSVQAFRGNPEEVLGLFQYPDEPGRYPLWGSC
jgi:asparagine synthase (glutamine-hydrolysing)